MSPPARECPFCGSRKTTYACRQIICISCGARGPVQETEGDSVRSWNWAERLKVAPRVTRICDWCVTVMAPKGGAPPCACYSPTGRFACTRERGHEGEHVACSDRDHRLSSWNG